MSVANVILESTRVRLVSDTVGYRGKEPALFERKITIASRARVALVVRGRAALGGAIIESADEWTDFEAALKSIADDLESAPLLYLPEGGAEATVLGWHDGGPKASRLMAAVVDGVRTVRRFDLTPGVYLAPSLGKHVISPNMTDEQVLKVAMLQQSIAVRHGLNICVGGDIELAEINADGVSIRKIGEYADKAKTAARILKLDERAQAAA